MIEDGQQHIQNSRGGSGKSSVSGITVILLILVAGVILAAFFLCPVLQVFGNTMSPALAEGSYVVSLRGTELEDGDVCAFYCSNKILVRRVIAREGEWVDIDENGTVYVNNQEIEEPYVTDPDRGFCDIDLPCQVPESRYFVMGDCRSGSADSRTEAIGYVEEEQIVGKIIFCIWPLNRFGLV